MFLFLQIFSECTVNVRTEWQHELHRILDRDKVHAEVLKVLRACANVKFTEDGFIVTAVQGPVRAVFTAETELEYLADQLKRAACVSLSPTCPVPGQSTGERVAQVGHPTTTTRQTSESARDEAAHVSDGNSSDLPQPPNRTKKAKQQGQISETATKEADGSYERTPGATYSDSIGVDFCNGIYLKETYETSYSRGIKLTIIPGIGFEQHKLEVTATCEKQLHEALETLGLLYSEILYKQNIVSWPVWLNADFNSTQPKKDLLKHGIVLYRMASHRSDINGTTQSAQRKSEYCVIGPQQKMFYALQLLIDQIVNVSQPFPIDSSLVQSNAAKSQGNRVVNFITNLLPDKNTSGNSNYHFKTSCGLEVHIGQGRLYVSMTFFLGARQRVGINQIEELWCVTEIYCAVFSSEVFKI